MNKVMLFFLLVWSPANVSGGWLINRPHDGRQPAPPSEFKDARAINPGDPWPNDGKFRWLRTDVELPEMIGNRPVAGQCVGLQFSCGDGGEVWLNRVIHSRYDNDHPTLVLLTTNAILGEKLRIDAQVYGKVQGGDRFGEAKLVLIERSRACEPLRVSVDAASQTGPVPSGLVGLSQGGGVSDYQDTTAAKLKDANFKWFRMDNVFTQVLKKGTYSQWQYDWRDFDQRLDFISRIGADAIMAVSYMPQVLDAVPNHERQSAPNDYAAWEDLCYRAAQRALERGKSVAFWEVWNEVNTGWLKPGPQDTGSDAFHALYSKALGKEATDREVVRRFEAYCKLYRATANGVRRADPNARVGGPALASGPFEHESCGHCFHGRGFARGLMLWCQQEKLPLDFVSWHEYFQPPEVFIKEAAGFRNALADFPALAPAVKSLMITEWNQAWWADRPQDHEVGAAWAANCLTRAFIPHQIDRPCFFYVKQGDKNFRGDYSILLGDNTPKAAYNVLKIFNHLSGNWVQVHGGDGEVSAVAAWDPSRPRLAVVLVNFKDRFCMRRVVGIDAAAVPSALRGSVWRAWTVDVTNANAWHDLARAELAQTASGKLNGTAWNVKLGLAPNSVTLLEISAP